tara:strand:+ start:25014 stop:26378 length:1365 start_codon:yes stop_codon:yes gene_type:complete
LLKFIHHIRHLFFLDKATSWGYAQKIAQSLQGFVAIFIIAYFIDLKTQGYLYTFVSLLSLQFVFELGLTQVIITFVAYEKNGLHKKEPFVRGKYKNYIRFKNIASYAISWFTWASLGYFFVSLAIGFLIFYEPNEENNFWFYPYLLLCFVSSIQVFCISIYAIKEGLSALDEVYKFRFIRTVLMIIFYGLLLMLGADLWSLSIAHTIIAITDLYFLFLNKNLLGIAKKGKKNLKLFNWKTEMLPMQTKIAVASISGVLSFTVFVPLAFVMLGPEVAGRLGMSLAIVGGISTLSIVPSVVSTQKMSALVESNNMNEANKLAKELILVSFVIHILSFFLLLSLYFFFQAYFPSLIERVLQPKIFIMLFISSMLGLITHPLAVYMRAHKEEPLMWVSILHGLFVSIGSYIGVVFFQVFGIGLAYLISGLVTFPVTLIIFWNFFKSKYSKERAMNNNG